MFKITERNQLVILTYNDPDFQHNYGVFTTVELAQEFAKAVLETDQQRDWSTPSSIDSTIMLGHGDGHLTISEIAVNPISQ